MKATVLVDGRATDHVDVADRGLAYGDGVFESLLVADSALVWWEAHVARLQRGCERLAIQMPAAELLREECAELARGESRAVLKLILTRGATVRGYAPHQPGPTRRILSLHPAPVPSVAAARFGLRLHPCALRLALQPALAGIKHLNRLEQVLARAEWSDPELGEGLLCDSTGGIVSATAANLFLVRAGRVVTPDLSQCGVEGTCRAWVLARVDTRIQPVDTAQLDAADELFLTSSVRGILPVARIGGRRWNVGPMTQSLQQVLWREVPALEPAPDVT